MSNEIKKIRVITRIAKNPSLSYNGGDYNFWKTYTRVSSGWIVHYFSSSDFRMCSGCGTFSNDCECEPQVVDLDQNILGKIKKGEYILVGEGVIEVDMSEE